MDGWKMNSLLGWPFFRRRVTGDPVKFSTYRAFSPARHANFRFLKMRAAVLWGGVGMGGGVGCNDIRFPCAHALCYAIPCAHARCYAIVPCAHARCYAIVPAWRTCSMLRNCSCAHVDATQLYKHGCPLDRCLINISVADYNL